MRIQVRNSVIGLMVGLVVLLCVGLAFAPPASHSREGLDNGETANEDECAQGGSGATKCATMVARFALVGSTSIFLKAASIRGGRAVVAGGDPEAGLLAANSLRKLRHSDAVPKYLRKHSKERQSPKRAIVFSLAPIMFQYLAPETRLECGVAPGESK